MSTEVMPTAVKNCPKSNDKCVTYIAHIASQVEGNSLYANASPSGAELKAAAGALASANASAKKGGPIAVAARNATRRDVDQLVDKFVVYVRGLVRSSTGDVKAATSMILGAGLAIRKPRTSSQAPLTAKPGSFSGDMTVRALAVGKTAIYMWEVSLDQQSWTSLPQTLTATTRLSGLKAGQTYYFRFRAQTRKGLGDYSDVVKVMAM